MERAEVDLDELVEFWTLLDEDRELLVGERGGSALAFAVLLKHYSRHGCFPRGRADVPGNVVEFLARQSASVRGCSMPTSGRGARSTTTGPRSGPTWGSGRRRSAIRRS